MYNGEEALDVLDKTHIDLIITDVMMPVMDGFELLDEIRGVDAQTPILFITARGSFEDKDRGFHSGVDDYMVKPIDIKEMVLRVEALLRRAKIANEHKLQVGSTVLDSDKLIVSCNGDVQALSPKEFHLLFKLLSYPGKVFTRYELMDEIWGYDSQSGTKTVDVHISKLRTRFDDCSDFKIAAIRGLGYKVVIS